METSSACSMTAEWLLDRCAALASIQRLHDLTASTLRYVVELTGATTGFFLRCQDDGTVTLQETIGASRAPVEIPASAELVACMARLSHPVLLPSGAAAQDECAPGLEFLSRLHANVLVPLTTQGRLIALIAVQTGRTLSAETLAALERLATVAGDLLGHGLRAQAVADSLDAFCQSLGDLIDARTGADATHSARVAAYAAMTAAQLGWHHDEVEAARRAGFLHDIGKLSVPDDILRKSGRLTADELARVRRANLDSAALLDGIPMLQAAATMIQHLGERWDGQGYPDGLAEEAIPIGARLLAVAHRFAVALMPRADRAPIVRMNGVLAILDRESGTSLDPRMVTAFMEALGHTK